MTSIRAVTFSTIWLGLMILSAPLSTHAATKWTFHENSVDELCKYGCDETYTKSKTFVPESGGGPDVKVTAWSDSSSTGDIVQGKVGGPWSGLGVKNYGGDSGEGSSPEHSMDSQRLFDTLRFDFLVDVTLTSIMVGWYHEDSDISVLAYTGAGNAPTVKDRKYSELIGDGWELVGDFFNVHEKENDTVEIKDGPTSSSWLIAAFNPIFSQENWNKKGNDYIKIKQLTGTMHTNGVPEPASVFLLAFALLLLWLFQGERIPRGSDQQQLIA